MEFTIVLDWTYFLLVHKKNINLPDILFLCEFGDKHFLPYLTKTEEEGEHCL